MMIPGTLVSWHDGFRRGNCYTGSARVGPFGYVQMSRCEESSQWPPAKRVHSLELPMKSLDFPSVTKKGKPLGLDASSASSPSMSMSSSSSSPTTWHDVASPQGPAPATLPECHICSQPYFAHTKDGEDHRPARVCRKNHVMCVSCTQKVLNTDRKCPFCREPLLRTIDVFVTPEALVGNESDLLMLGGAARKRRSKGTTKRRATSSRRRGPRSTKTKKRRVAGK